MRSVAGASEAGLRRAMVSVTTVLCWLGTASFLICITGRRDGLLAWRHGVWAVNPVSRRVRRPRNRCAWSFSMWNCSTSRALTVSMICRSALKRRRNELGRCRFQLCRAVQHKS